MKIIAADTPQLEQVTALLDQYRVTCGRPSDLPEARHFVFSRMTCHDSVIFLAVDEDETPLGFLQLYPSFSTLTLHPILVLSDLYVVPDVRRQHVARRLMEEAILFAKERNDPYLALDNHQNDLPVQRLCNHFGFHPQEAFGRYHLALN